MKSIVTGLKQFDVDGRDLKGILVTHEHSDHISSVGAISRKFNVPIYANEQTWQAMESRLGRIDAGNRRVFYNDMDFYIQDINVQPYQIPHDAADPVCFSFYYKNKNKYNH